MWCRAQSIEKGFKHSNDRMSMIKRSIFIKFHKRDLEVVVEGLAAILAVLEHVADLSGVVLVHRLKV